MRYLIGVISLILLFSCGKIPPTPTCTTTQLSKGVEIDCPGNAPVTILNGPQGPTGASGATGDIGPQGTAGINGTNGLVGIPGTIITPIQLCDSSFVPMYPSSFPEYALCISNNGVSSLYGVYSANGGFLAELPPGQYTSNGVNASCTFTIDVNCVIIN